MASTIQRLSNRIATLDTRRIKPPKKAVDPFYVSPEWVALMAEVIAERAPILMARQGHLCEDVHCKAKHWPGMRIFGDHIKELRDGGALLDKTNIMLRCGSSHSLKTAAQRARRLGEIAKG